MKIDAVVEAIWVSVEKSGLGEARGEEEKSSEKIDLEKVVSEH